MEPGGSMPHSQGLSNNSYPEFAMVVPNYPSGSEALCDVSEYPCFYSVRLLASRQTPQAGGPFLVGLPTTAYSICSQLTSISGGLLPHP